MKPTTKSTKRTWTFYRVFFWLILAGTLILSTAILSSTLPYRSHPEDHFFSLVMGNALSVFVGDPQPNGQEPNDQKLPLMVIITTGFAAFLFHFLLLRFSRQLSTRRARLLAILPSLLLFILVLCAFSVLHDNQSGPFIGFFLIPYLLLTAFSGFVAFSLPCTLLSALPLLMSYLMIALLVGSHGKAASAIIALLAFAMSGYLFPRHRRLREYWRPAPLPRLRATRSGVTLIELLIVIAIVAILSVCVANLSGGVRAAATRQEDWRRAVSLAEDQIALLRAAEALPAEGRHPIAPELAARYEFAQTSEIEIRPGPAPALREVRVNIHLRGHENRRDVTLAALLPARPQEVK